MALTEIEFELTAHQFELMEYPKLEQGHALSVQLETAVLLPEAGAENWFDVRKEMLASSLIPVGRALYAFSGQIETAEMVKENGLESATVLVRCGEAPLRISCAPYADGQLPYGTWETRYLSGHSRLYGIVEDDFAVGIGETVGVTVWSFRRLVLTPGDPNFGQWYESYELPPAPFVYDRIIVNARLHRTRS